MECLSDDIVKAFESMVIRTDFSEAFEVIRGICDAIPPPSLIRNIIFNVLMENREKSIANEANAYLCNYLMLLPPKSRNFHYCYLEALQDKSGKFDSIWSVFSHLVKSCFSHYNIVKKKKIMSNSKLVKYPNCDILISFYTEMCLKFLSLENDLFEDDPKERFSSLLEWINKVYKRKSLRPYPVLDSLHMLLDKTLDSDVLYDTSTDKFELIANLIVDKCPDVFKDVEKIKGFFIKSSMPLVPLRICQNELYKLIFHEQISNETHMPLTLKTIIYNYFFFDKKQEGKRKTQGFKAVKNKTNDPKQLAQIFSVKSTKGDSILHELCRKNLYGDLFEVLLNNPNLEPNARNDAGYTPIHLACLSNSYYCVKFLLEDVFTDEKVDITTTNLKGLTPLHCAAYVDSVDIVQILLKHGGVKLATLKDKFEKKAVDYAQSQKMKELLQNSESTLESSSSNDKLISDLSDSFNMNMNLDCLTVPVMKDKNELSLFLFYLHSILSNYLDRYNLFNSKNDRITKLSHKKCDCHHYISTSSASICEEDASVFERLPQLLDTFLECIQSDARNNEFEIRKDLLPLIILRKMLEF